METEADRQGLIAALGGQPVVGGADRFCAVFDNEFTESLDTEARVPVLTCSTADVTRCEVMRKGTTLEVEGVTYKVRRHEPDGTGMSRLILEQ